MLAIRMQRTGRKGHPMYRVIVQDSHRQPTSGKVVAMLGSYDPHAKTATLDKEKTALFLKNGAQPSDRVVKLLLAEKVALPSWVNVPSDKKQKTIKNLEKLRRNRPEEPKVEPEEATNESPAETEAADTSAQEAPVAEEQNAEPKEDTAPETSEQPADEPAAEEAAPAPEAEAEVKTETEEPAAEQPADEEADNTPDTSENAA